MVTLKPVSGNLINKKCDVFSHVLYLSSLDHVWTFETGPIVFYPTCQSALLLFVFLWWCWATVCQCSVCSVKFWSIFLSHFPFVLFLFLTEKFQYLWDIEGNVPSVRSTFLPQHCVSLRIAEFCLHDFFHISRIFL